MVIPELCLVVLIGPSGSGKTTFARRCFRPGEVVSGDDRRRGAVSGDSVERAVRGRGEVAVRSPSKAGDGVDAVWAAVAARLSAGRLAVVDASNVEARRRRPLVALARRFHCRPVAIVFDLPESVCLERNRAQSDGRVNPSVIRRQCSELRASLPGLRAERFRQIHVFTHAEDVEVASVERVPLDNNRRDDHGPFDIIGDVHGCFDELVALLAELGYEADGGAGFRPIGEWIENHGGDDIQFRRRRRKVVFLGDLVDRGPKIVPVLRLVMAMVEAGVALCVPGNHDAKVVRLLRGGNLRLAHGLAASKEQLERESAEFRERVCAFLDGLVSHYVLDEGRLVVAHAGMKARMQGRRSGAVRAFALFGETTGEIDAFGLPVRVDWAADYRGEAMVVYGHTPVDTPMWRNHTINIDTGCVYGGRLTALRYPERALVSIPARRVYSASAPRKRRDGNGGDGAAGR